MKTSAEKVAKAYLKQAASMPRIQYHATPWHKVPSILKRGLQLPRGFQDASTLMHDPPSISTTDKPGDAQVYFPRGALLKVRVKPGAKYLIKNIRGMRKGESLLNAVNRWGREALSMGADGFYMEDLQSTVGNQTVNPKVLQVIEVMNPEMAPPNLKPYLSGGKGLLREAASSSTYAARVYILEWASGNGYVRPQDTDPRDNDQVAEIFSEWAFSLGWEEGKRGKPEPKLQAKFKALARELRILKQIERDLSKGYEEGGS